MNSLFVSNTFPFPARDGVTLPFSNYAKLFRKYCGPVDLLLLQKASVDLEHRNANLDFFENVFEIPIESTGFANRILGQWAGRAPYFSGWTPVGTPPAELARRNYENVVSTPRAVVQTVHQLRDSKHINAKFHIAAVNDIATLAKGNLSATALKTGKSIKHLVRALKLSSQRFGLAAAEKRLLSESCDLFIVQSDAEIGWVQSQKSMMLEKKAIQLSNGVDDVFFNTPLAKPELSCTFVGAICGEYKERVRWLVEEVWPPVKSDFPDAKFTLSGKCENNEMFGLLSKHKVNHRKFVENPEDLYADQAILLAPIFKGYGLINKVIQSMAAGTVVIGDPTAFNAIPGFVAGEHGIVASSPTQFVELLAQAFENPDSLLKIRSSARELIRENFQWDSRYHKLQSRLKMLSKKH